MTVYDFEVKQTNGELVSLSKYKGKALLIVNTASQCGFTPQYKALEKLYNEFKDEGLVILGFPSDDFGGQEPLAGEELQQYCEINHGVTFPIFDKLGVKAPDAHPLFKYLSDKSENGKVGAKPRWNFHKYLVDPSGKVVDFFYPFTSPLSDRLKRKIKLVLREKS